GLLVALALFISPTIDLVLHQERLVNLWIFRYDRPWPGGPPWRLDFAPVLLVFGVLFGLGLLAALVERWRRPALVGLLITGWGFQVVATTVFLPAASPHWGQRTLIARYYKDRNIHGADIIYYGPAAFERDWASGADLEIRSAIPTTLHVGDPMTIRWQLRN